MATLFFSYSHADEGLRDELEKQLTMLKRQGIIEAWHDRRIGAGTELSTIISEHVENDDIILLLVSADFLASDYCYNREMIRVMQRYEAGETVVIPVILRACEWHDAPFGKLMATPPDGRPVTQWPDKDQAFLEVTRAIRKAAERLGSSPKPLLPLAAFSATQTSAASPSARSSNLRIAKSFSERDRDQFKLDTFEYIAKFFEASLAELSARNPGVEGNFRRVDANRFTSTIYQNGKAAARCTIFMAGDRYMSGGIAFLFGETTSSNSYNESLSVQADDQSMYFTSMGMAAMGRARDQGGKLSQEGAAELYWGMLIHPLQQGAH